MKNSIALPDSIEDIFGELYKIVDRLTDIGNLGDTLYDTIQNLKEELRKVKKSNGR